MGFKRHVVLWLGIALLSACASGGAPRRVSEPAASIQQLTVQADGRWSVDVRLQNYSSIPMEFERVEFKLSVGGEEAGTLNAAPALTIGPASADVVSVDFDPSSNARIVVADALSAGRGVRYALDGEIAARPDDRRKAQDYDFKRESQLSPVPGLVGVMR